MKNTQPSHWDVLTQQKHMEMNLLIPAVSTNAAEQRQGGVAVRRIGQSAATIQEVTFSQTRSEYLLEDY